MKTSILAVLLLVVKVMSLECDNGKLKITIKTDPEEYEFDEYEQYLLKATIAYSVRKYCGGGTSVTNPTCNNVPPYTNTSDVSITDPTPRIAMCVKVTDVSEDTVRAAIKQSKANLNGALILTDDELFVEGIQPTLEPEYDPEFDLWLIPYIVICCLVILAGLAMVLYSRFHKDDKEDKISIVDEDDYIVPTTYDNTAAFNKHGGEISTML